VKTSDLTMPCPGGGGGAGGGGVSAYYTLLFLHSPVSQLGILRVLSPKSLH